MGKGGEFGGSAAEEPVVGRDRYWADGGILLQELCRPPLAETVLWSGRTGSTAGKDSSSGPAVGQPCSACMGSSGRTPLSPAPSQISKVNTSQLPATG